MATARDGRADFDFLLGSWRVHNVRLNPEGEWEQIEAELHARPVLGGLGHIDEFRVPELPGGGFLHGVAMRLFDPDQRVWRDWWGSTRRPGHLDPPAVGGFSDGVGTFVGDDVVDGRPVRVRYTWTEVATGAPRWEQAFSGDAGRTWETNWLMSLSRSA